jgi:hypothetical protein
LPNPDEEIVMAKASSRSASEEAVLDRLDTILRVLALQVAADKSITERARLLKMAGLDNRTIANVLNTSDATIRTLTSNLRVKRGRR